jgi:hypothetical protein
MYGIFLVRSRPPSALRDRRAPGAAAEIVLAHASGAALAAQVAAILGTLATL